MNMSRFRSTAVNVHFRKGSGIQTFRPGDLLEADIEVISDKPVECHGIEVSVGWHTEGRGDRNSETVYVEPFGVIMELSPDEPVKEFFSCRLPSQPWSYTGELINIVWAVRVKVIFRVIDLRHEETFILQP